MFSESPRHDVLFCFDFFIFVVLRNDSDTPLAKMVQSPQLVRDMDWLNRCWPESRKQEGQFPKVGGLRALP